MDFMFITQCGRLTSESLTSESLTSESILIVFSKVVIVENSDDPCTVCSMVAVTKVGKTISCVPQMISCLFTLYVASWRDVLHSCGVFLQFKVVMWECCHFCNL